MATERISLSVPMQLVATYVEPIEGSSDTLHYQKLHEKDIERIARAVTDTYSRTELLERIAKLEETLQGFRLSHLALVRERNQLSTNLELVMTWRHALRSTSRRLSKSRHASEPNRITEK